MNPAWGHVAGVITVIVMLIFVGIWIWAWRPRHARTFERLAQIPMEDVEAGNPRSDAAPVVADRKPTS